ncbi:maleylpyruvate isomerase N-terminal domain-containing protein [Nocardioides sp. WV_118_6]|uniref:maleylpyruvate isomerase N-terminal domain-containing protein n=1 Tax=Nocardioides simplex TaxID=2045 RepID=UPI00214F95E0|nr:maleylpyruvate isomerase N-terminal domain-containing protein [Pimelobacter simplex]UUW88197.1 maleylpyruvate isomerase N-terminal domain-containing protein [Pimelobacter simplex]UUW97702.1 maleylpyruvate isomerase N-terminal domain-containing protein [Pimelobacter simplex]
MDHASFVDAARIALDLARTTEVKAAWSLESSCAGMTVGGLAHHLVQQAGHTVRLLSLEPVAEPPIPLLEHYARAAWVEAGPDDEANVSVREGADAAAAAGPDDVVAHGAAALERLPAVLHEHHTRIPDQVRIPWQGWSLTTGDFLVTRAMEIVVHADDLASSVGLATPEFPEDLVTDVLGLLGAIALRRHGQAAVVRTLSRPQRAPANVSAF